MRFTIVNASTAAAPLSKLITAPWLSKVADALTTQLDRDVSSYWGGAYSSRIAPSVVDVIQGEVPFLIVDDLPDSPGAIAAHGAPFGYPTGWIALNQCHTLDDVSTGISHEFCETAGDAAINIWADNFADNYAYARELCDAVESFSYKIGDVLVSDFVLPPFFSPGQAGPYHYLAATGQGLDLTEPFATGRGGYQVRRAIGGGEAQVWGEIPKDKASKKLHPTSRTYKRLNLHP
jgi:hypothetical protein